MLRVGITGHHTAERLPESEVPRIARELKSALMTIEACLGRIAKDPELGYAFSSAAPQLYVISPLAERADRITAKAAIELGCQYEALLPFTLRDYEDDFATEASKVEFRQLIEKASTTFALDPSPLRPRTESYATTGQLLLDQSDLLLALWDGEPARGIGGTAEVIANAQRRGLPIIWFHTKNPTESVKVFHGDQWSAADLAPAEITDSVLFHLIRNLTPAFSQEPTRRDADHAAAKFAFDRYIAEFDSPFEGRQRWLLSWRNTYRAFVRAMAWLGARALRHHHGQASPPPETQAAAPAPVATDDTPVAHLLDHLRERVRMRFEAADRLATDLSHTYRSAYVLNFGFAGLAVITGLFAVFAWDNIAVKVGCIVLESIWIGLVLLLTYVGQSQNWHGRWLELRTLSEFLRSGPILALVGSVTNVSTLGARGQGEDWSVWYARASMRELGLPNVQTNRQYLSDLIDVAIRTAIDPQIAYHRRNRIQLTNVHEGIEWLGRKLFWMTLFVGLAFVPFALFILFSSADQIGWPVKYVFKPTVTFLAAGLPAIGAALAGIRAQGDFQASAQRSLETEQMLEVVRADLLRARLSPDFATVRSLLILAGETMNSDLKAWNQLYRNRPIPLPS